MLGGKEELGDGGNVVEDLGAFNFDLAILVVVYGLVEGIATGGVAVEDDGNALIAPRWLRSNRFLCASKNRSVSPGYCRPGVLVRAKMR